MRCWTRRQVCFSRDRGGFKPEKKKHNTSSGLFWGSREARNVCSSRWLLLDFKPLGAARQQLPQARALPFYGRGSLRREGRGCSWAQGSWQQPQDPTTPDVALQAPSQRCCSNTRALGAAAFGVCEPSALVPVPTALSELRVPAVWTPQVQNQLLRALGARAKLPAWLSPVQQPKFSQQSLSSYEAAPAARFPKKVTQGAREGPRRREEIPPSLVPCRGELYLALGYQREPWSLRYVVGAAGWGLPGAPGTVFSPLPGTPGHGLAPVGPAVCEDGNVPGWLVPCRGEQPVLGVPSCPPQGAPPAPVCNRRCR